MRRCRPHKLQILTPVECRKGVCLPYRPPVHVRESVAEVVVSKTGTSFLATGNPKAARDALIRCSALTPDDPKVHNNLGLALAAERQYEAAIGSFSRALQLRPDYARALNNRATSLMNLQRFDEVLFDLERALTLEPTYTQALLNRGATLRAAGLFERHDRARFECFALSHGTPRTGDAMSGRLQSAFEHFEDIHRLSARQIAERVRALEIDLLVDLKGYTADSRIEVLSHRAAPVQAHYLGYPGTLGAAFVDYLIADNYLVPPCADEHYAEKIARLPHPHTYQVTDDRRAVSGGEPWTRARAGLPATGVVLAAFHQTYKLDPPIFDVWMRLLRQIPDACLWLLDNKPAARPHLVQAAAIQG